MAVKIEWDKKWTTEINWEGRIVHIGLLKNRLEYLRVLGLSQMNHSSRICRKEVLYGQ